MPNCASCQVAGYCLLYAVMGHAEKVVDWSVHGITILHADTISCQNWRQELQIQPCDEVAQLLAFKLAPHGALDTFTIPNLSEFGLPQKAKGGRGVSPIYWSCAKRYRILWKRFQCNVPSIIRICFGFSRRLNIFLVLNSNRTKCHWLHGIYRTCSRLYLFLAKVLSSESRKIEDHSKK